MRRAPIALPEAEISADWDTRRGGFILHPAGLADGVRPEWDQVRARVQQFAAGARPAIVRIETPGLGQRIRRLIERAFT